MNPVNPEANLALAVIERALLDIHGNLEQPEKHNQERIKRRAKRWLNSNSNQPGSFNFWCSIANVSPNYARKKIKNYIPKKEKRRIARTGNDKQEPPFVEMHT